MISQKNMTVKTVQNRRTRFDVIWLSKCSAWNRLAVDTAQTISL